MLVKISGKDIELTEDEFEEFCENLRKAGFYPTSIEYQGLDMKSTEEVMLVGNNKVWKDE